MRHLAPNRHSGFTLVEVLIGAALASILMLGITSLFSGLSKTTKIQQLNSARDAIVIAIRKTASHPLSIRRSGDAAYNNTNLRRCLNLAVAGACTDGTLYDYSLYDAAQNRITGTSANPVYYRPDGTLCGTVSSPGCPIRVWTQFVPECLGGGCQPATANDVTIYTYFTVDQAVDAHGLPGYRIRPVSANAALTSSVPGIVLATDAINAN